MTSVRDRFNETKLYLHKMMAQVRANIKSSLFVLANFAPLIIDIVVGWS